MAGAEAIMRSGQATAANGKPLTPKFEGIRDTQWWKLLSASAIAAGAYHLAWSFPWMNAVILVYAWALLRISESTSTAVAFRLGFLAGFLVFAPEQAWFWNIFGVVALCLWAVLSFFIGLFTALVQIARRRFSPKYLWFGTAVLWTGVEYFRSELYPLRFSWFSVGYVFSDCGGLLPKLGVYGIGFLVFALAACTLKRGAISKLTAFATLIAFANFPITSNQDQTDTVRVAGVQLEFPADLELPKYLDQVLEKHPDTQILVLSEYSFDGPVPTHIREWCRKNERFLIAGGKEEATEVAATNFRNTAFVVGPTGQIIFQQCKSVPIQFFNDGLPALSQQIWESPWGKIAIPVCYDLSYRLITDRFVSAGAEGFIVPFMDVTDWGEIQHWQHARIAPMRAREYGLSVFRLGSSGISQHVDPHGKVLTQADFPGQGEIIAGSLQLGKPRFPLDRSLAPICSALVLIFLLVMSGLALQVKIKMRRGKLVPTPY
jgi:apolipoprotein N-acyltransferase